jgi:hypothetical protein
MKHLLFAVVAGFSLVTLQVQAATIQQTIASINADAAKPGGPERMAKSISAKTGVPAATLEQQKAKTGLTYGDLFIAHAIARASGKTFDQVAALKAKGQDWDKIADDNNVSLGGKKKVVNKTEGPGASPGPSATPMKTGWEIQKDRWSHKTEVTNAPKPKGAQKGPSPTPTPFQR